MSFLAPYMLWGALAAGIPIALHFFYRSRYRDVPWAAMKFLLTAVEQTSRRLRFQELLLLVLRVTLLLLLAVALARPTLRAIGRGRGDAVDAVLLIDQSMSMGARAGVVPLGASPDAYLDALRGCAGPDGGVSRFDRARAAALAVLDGLPRGSTVQVIGVSDRAALLGPRTPSHLDQARALIEQMTLTSTGTDLEPAVSQAAKLLEAGPSPGKELHVFGDMQRSGFERNAGRLAGTLQEMRGKVMLHFVHCGTAPVGNVTLAGITPQTTLRSGERADFAVLVRNTAQVPLHNLVVTLEMDGKSAERDSQPLAVLDPGATRAVVLSALIDRPGRHVLSATVRPDDLPGDNRLDQVIVVHDQVGVLVVDGAPNPGDPRRSASFFLRHALDPAAQAGRLPITVLTPEQTTPRDLGGKEVCILVNARLERAGRDEGSALSEEFVRALGNFVQEGHALMIFPGDRVEPESYNRVLFDQLRLLPYRIAKMESQPVDRPWLLDRASAASGPFARFREEAGYASIDRIETRRRLALAPPRNDEAQQLTEESRVLLRYRDGQIAVAARKRPGQGEVLLWTTSVNDSAWSDLFIAPAFVPLLQVSLHHLLEGHPGQLNRVAGEVIEWQVPRGDAEQAHDLVGPDGSRRRLGFPVSVKGRPLLSVTDVRTAGLYRIVPAGREVDPAAPLIAVGPDTRETEDLQTLSGEQIDQRLGISARHVIAGNDGTVFSAAERLRSEWTGWLLLVLLVLVLAEMALAWWCGRSW
jgi:hypothetical protein